MMKESKKKVKRVKPPLRCMKLHAPSRQKDAYIPCSR